MKIAHFGLFGVGNAGDTMLFRQTQEIFKFLYPDISFVNYNIHKETTEKQVEEINFTCDKIIVGGGGLFLRDTKPNENSGWQWNCSVRNLVRLRKPLILFGVGYNRFRGQKEFNPVFKKHINALASKSRFIGLRNEGSIVRIKRYLAEPLQKKVIYQPCPTTMISKFLTFNKEIDKKKIILNIPFDRTEFRYGKHKERILKNISSAMKELSKIYTVEAVFHCGADINMLLPLEEAEVTYTTKHLQGKDYQTIFDYYKDAYLVVSGRGHGQQIPFGFNNLFVSLISHDKLKFFLEDTGLVELGLEMTSNELTPRLLNLIETTIKNEKQIREKMTEQQEKLWTITETNIKNFIEE